MGLITEEQLEGALTFMKRKAVDYAQAKANRRYTEEFRKTLKARLYQEAPDGTVADKEAFAYGHHDYEENLLGLKAAVDEEEQLRWQLEAARITTEIYRTQHADGRRMDRAAQ